MDANNGEQTPNDANASNAREPASALMYVEDIQAALGCGQHFAYDLAHRLGRRIGRRWGVLRSELASWLVLYSRAGDGAASALG